MVLLAGESPNIRSCTLYIYYIYTRDGSYGLLRRPIRYNTLLLRNTRIIRKRIYAILGGYPELAPTTLQPPRMSPQPPEHYIAS